MEDRVPVKSSPPPGGEERGGGEGGAPEKSSGGPMKSSGGPERSSGGPERSSGGPERSSGGPMKSSGGPQRSSRGPERSSGGPERSSGGPERSSGGPMKSSGGPEKSSGGPERSSGGPEKSSGGPERSSGGPERSSGGPERSSGGLEKSSGGPEKSSGGPDRSSGGPERSSGGGLTAAQLAVLERCLHGLKHAKNDSHTLAALLLISRLCPASQLDPPTLRRLFQAVGLNLPARLLMTAVRGSEGSALPPQELLSLGSALLAALSTDPDLASHPQLLATVPVLLGLLADGPVQNRGPEQEADPDPVGGTSDDGTRTPPEPSTRLDEGVAADCYQVLMAVCGLPRGPDQLLSRAAVPALCRAVDRNQTLSRGRGLDLLGRLLSGRTRTKAWRRHPAELLALLVRLSKDFCRSSDQNRLGLCSQLVRFLPPAGVEVQSEDLKGAVGRVWAGLRPVLQARLTPRQMGPVLVLSACLLDLQGWEPVGPPKFCCLLVNRACVEVRMGLEEPPGSDLSPELQQTLTGCYRIMEASMEQACLQSSPQVSGSGLSLQQSRQVLGVLEESFSSLMFYLQQVDPSRYGDPFVFATVRCLCTWLAEETSCLREEVTKLLPFLIGYSRKHLQEDSDQKIYDQKHLQDDSDQKIYNQKHLQEDSDQKIYNQKHLQEDSDQKIYDQKHLQEDGADQKIYDQKHLQEDSDQKIYDQKHLQDRPDQKIYDWMIEEEEGWTGSEPLRYLLPALCHLSAEEGPRRVLLVLEAPALLVDFLSRCWSSMKGGGGAMSRDPSMETACSALLNFTVTEPERVRNDSCFRNLQVLLTEALPVLVNKPRLLVLAANYCTLGLMIGRLESSPSGSVEAAQRRFFSAALRFLGGALDSSPAPGPAPGPVTVSPAPGPGPGPVTVSPGWAESWEEVVELWRLSLQALGGCVLVQPSLCALLRDEGWTSSTVRMLDRADALPDHNTQRVLEEALRAVAQQSPVCRQEIRDTMRSSRGALSRMKDLKTVLD